MKKLQYSINKSRIVHLLFERHFFFRNDVRICKDITAHNVSNNMSY